MTAGLNGLRDVMRKRCGRPVDTAGDEQQDSPTDAQRGADGETPAQDEGRRHEQVFYRAFRRPHRVSERRSDRRDAPRHRCHFALTSTVSEVRTGTEGFRGNSAGAIVNGSRVGGRPFRCSAWTPAKGWFLSKSYPSRESNRRPCPDELWREKPLPCVGFVAVALAFSWPLPLHLTEAVLGTGDTPVYVWNLWVFRHEIVYNHHLPFLTSSILALSQPLPLALHNYTTFANLLAFPLLPVIGLVRTFNLLLIAGQTMTAYAMYRYARMRTGDSAAAWLGGLIFGFSPYMTARSAEHFSLILAAPLPLFAWLLYRIHKQGPSFGLSCGAGATVAWAFLCDPYYAVYCLMLAMFFVGHSAVTVERRSLGARGDWWRAGLDLTILCVAGLIVGARHPRRRAAERLRHPHQRHAALHTDVGADSPGAAAMVVADPAAPGELVATLGLHARPRAGGRDVRRDSDAGAVCRRLAIWRAPMDLAGNSLAEQSPWCRLAGVSRAEPRPPLVRATVAGLAGVDAQRLRRERRFDSTGSALDDWPVDVGWPASGRHAHGLCSRYSSPCSRSVHSFASTDIPPMSRRHGPCCGICR